jgi:glyoxylase-like metal-dependent hydrolase (beta-lactamase superfamily II)
VSTTEITTRLTRVVHRRVFNCYLVVEDDGLTLVDTGPPGAVPTIQLAIKRAQAPLRRIVLTHAHGDHVGGLDGVLAAFDAELEIIIARREAGLLCGDFTLAPGEPGPPPRPRGYGSPRARPSRLVGDGDHIGSLRVIATPGHTPGHISLIDARDRTLITGDAVTTLGRTAVSGDLVLRWPFPAVATWNKRLALQSARRLMEEQPARLLSGHGPPKDAGTVELANAIAAATGGTWPGRGVPVGD